MDNTQNINTCDPNDIIQYSKNRELSWLNFNKRVLDEAMDDLTPEFESLKFVAIWTSNLEEYYRVRVGSLTDISNVKEAKPDSKTFMTPKEQLAAILEKTRVYMKDKDKVFKDVMKNLGKYNIEDVAYKDLTKKERKEIEKYYYNYIEPILTPQVIDAQHPFPFIENNKIHIALELDGKNGERIGLVPIPDNVKRYFLLDREGISYIRIENIIKELAGNTFTNYKILSSQTINLFRSADIDIEDYLYESDEDYRSIMKSILKKRNRLQVVALHTDEEMSKNLKSLFTKNLGISDEQFFVTTSPLIMDYVFELEDLVEEKGLNNLLYKPFTPQHNPLLDMDSPLLEQVLERDVLFIYPYEDVEEFIKILEEAAEDPRVTSIKITIYRLAKNSKVVRALLKALENGKRVTALMELQARFDEQSNIDYSDVLLEAGCNIIYGIGGYKVHSKVCLITMEEGDKITHITQIGTGNYNEKTSKQYTDLSLITGNKAIGLDAVNFFQNMSIGNVDGHYSTLIVSPISFKPRIMELIDEEISKGEDGYLFFKFNSFTDKDLIIKLAEASQAGVKIKLIIRGICCLRPGIECYTENIEVRSIVGRYLEHPRIFISGKGKLSKIYIGSADLMTRNTEKRVEVATPIFDSDLKQKIIDYMDNQWKDNTKARYIDTEGEYQKLSVKEDEPIFISQDEEMKKAIIESEKSISLKKPEKEKSFFQRLLDLFK